jgi:hypothetical protein
MGIGVRVADRRTLTLAASTECLRLSAWWLRDSVFKRIHLFLNKPWVARVSFDAHARTGAVRSLVLWWGTFLPWTRDAVMLARDFFSLALDGCAQQSRTFALCTCAKAQLINMVYLSSSTCVQRSIQRSSQSIQVVFNHTNLRNSPTRI